ncbi:MAG: putative Ig domain-containing protein [Gammaproteobacteria bacterium]|nr:putative Ig domain-containing protein [Gammaproteobacteria bacterium]
MSATLFESVEAPGRFVLAIRGTEQGYADLLVADGLDIVTDGIAIDQLVDLYNLFQQLTTPSGAGYQAARLQTLAEETSAYQLARAGSLIPGWQGTAQDWLAELRARTDVVIDNPTGRVRTIVFEDSATVFADGRAAGLGYAALAEPGRLTVTGHSLGGHLAMACTRLLPALDLAAVTINGAGFASGPIAGLGGEAAVNLRNVFALLGGAPAFDRDRITNLYGSAAVELVTQNGPGLFQPGAHLEVHTESYALAHTLGHGSGQMTDALAVYDLFLGLGHNLQILPAPEALAVLGGVFAAATNEKLATFESLVDALDTVLATDAARIGAAGRGDREVLHVAIEAVRASAQYTALAGRVEIVPLFDLHAGGRIEALPADSLVAHALDGPDAGAWRHALVHLNPFVVRGVDDAARAELYAAAGGGDPAELSAAWLADRALLLTVWIEAGAGDTATVERADPALEAVTRFHDVATGLSLALRPSAAAALPDRNLWFGSARSDGRLAGADGDDRLYGLGGVDTLLGLAGADILDGGADADVLAGGAGTDWLLGGAGDDTLWGGEVFAPDDGAADRLEGGAGFDSYYAGRGDRITDSDGDGRVFVDLVRLTGGAHGDEDTPGRYLSADRRYAYALSGDTLRVVIDGDPDPAHHITVTGYRPGALGIELVDEDAAPAVLVASAGDDRFQLRGTPAGVVIEVDAGAVADHAGATRVVLAQVPASIHLLAGDDVLAVTGDFSGLQVHAGAGADIVRLEGLGTTSGAALHGEEGDDLLAGSLGDDLITGGEGVDTLFGGDGGDLVNGGAGSDWLEGHAGHDQIYAGAGADWLLGGAGIDQLSGDGGDDVLYGDAVGPGLAWAGRDFALPLPAPLFAGEYGVLSESDRDAAAGDVLLGGAGDDAVYGGGGDDLIDGGDDADHLEGEAGDDTLFGRAGDDELWGDANPLTRADDARVLHEVALADGTARIVWRLHGAHDDASGDDVLDGGPGRDRLYGGAGSDSYRFGYGYGEDTVLDSAGANDRVVLLEGIGPADVDIVPVAAGIEIALRRAGVLTGDVLTLLAAPGPTAGIERIELAGADALDLTVPAWVLEPLAIDTPGSYGGTRAASAYTVAMDPADGFRIDIADAGGADSLVLAPVRLDLPPEFGARYVTPVVTGYAREGADLRLDLRMDADIVRAPAQGTIHIHDYFGAGRIERLRTPAGELGEPNAAPRVTAIVGSRQAPAGERFALTLPADLFTDDLLDEVSLDARRADGRPLPAWLLFDPATRTLTGTPAVADSALFDVLITATDRHGATAVTSFSLEAGDLNDPPTVARAPADQVVEIGTELAFAVGADVFTDPDYGDHLTIDVLDAQGQPLPDWLHYDAGSGRLYGTPRVPDLGAALYAVRAEDRRGAFVSALFHIEVVAPPGGQGTALADHLIGGPGADVLFGAAGDDVLDGGDGDDWLIGGAGADRMAGGEGYNTYLIRPFEGFDTIVVEPAGEHRIEFGPGFAPADLTPRFVQGGGIGLEIRLHERTTAYGTQVGGALRFDGLYTGLTVAAGGLIGSVTTDAAVVDLDRYRLVFADGTQLPLADLLAIANRAPPPGSGGLALRVVPSGATAFTGTDDAELVLGRAGGERIDAAAGDDVVRGGEGDDDLSGAAGNDVLYGEWGADWLRGGAGDDELAGGPGDDVLEGGSGDDRYALAACGGIDRIADTDGFDTVRIGALGDTRHVTLDELLVFRHGDDLHVRWDRDAGFVVADWYLAPARRIDALLSLGAFGEAPIDENEGGGELFRLSAAELEALARPATAPRLALPPADQVLTAGVPWRYTLAAQTFVDADPGDSLLLAASLGGSALPDWLDFDAATATFSGTPDIDARGHYELAVTAVDTLGLQATGRLRLDVVVPGLQEGGPGADILRGVAAPDVIFGGAGRDLLLGGDGDDLLDGGEGNDMVNGGPGADRLRGGTGLDVLLGGPGADRYEAGPGQTYMLDTGGDDRYHVGAIFDAVRIRDLEGTADRLVLADARQSDLRLRRNGEALEIGIAGRSGRITVEGWYAPLATRIESIETSGDAAVLDALAAEQLAAAMAVFAPPVMAGLDPPLVGADAFTPGLAAAAAAA